ncbi:MAG: iron-containing redox enzyme family protein [Lentisphaeraceae bacterium]|nr:iron-containing redox enzyme family protein [Lentisphaeraceae bacterium]
MSLKGIEYCDQMIAEVDIYGNEYFKALSDGRMSVEEFQHSQQQFYFAVLFFARPMTALVARFPHPQQRLNILGNVLEEHGAFKQQAFHECTFRDFLQSIDCPVDSLAEVNLWPEVRAFNSALSTACIFDEVEVGVACMGVIEYAFAEISAMIGNAVVQRRWMKREELCHYKLHAAIDRRHAAEFFEIVEDSWSDPQKAYLIRQGIEMGLYIFDRLYSDLYKKARLKCQLQTA